MRRSARGSDGRDIAILWTNTVAFQKLQRLAHQDITQDEYLSFVAGHRGVQDRVYCLYASDAEIFGFRPGRYRTEEANQGDAEWQRIDAALGGLTNLEERPFCFTIASAEGPSRRGNPAAGNGGLSGARQKAAQIQSHPLGGYGARRYRHQCRLASEFMPP